LREKVSNDTTGPETSQQAIEKWEMAEPTRLAYGVLLLGKLAISELFRLLQVSSGL